MSVLVIGDSCTDKFIYCNIERICPEAPVPVMKPINETSNPGMAHNVVANLTSLNLIVDLITNPEPITKTRYVDSRSGQMVIRVDENDQCNRVDIKSILPSIVWENYNAVVISDYCKGFITEEDIEYIAQSHPLVFMDTKKQLGDWCKNIKFIKINTLEYLNNKSLLNTDKELLEKIIITKGPEGCMYRNKIYPTQEVPVKDVSGAGDTFIAALVTDYITDKNIIQAINFAQKCTTIVVQKPGVATI